LDAREFGGANESRAGFGLMSAPTVRILFLSPRQCWPATSGAKLREFYLARALSNWAELTYVYFSESGAAPLKPSELPFAAKIVAVPMPRVYGPLNILRGLAGKWPLPVLNYTSPRMTAALSRLDASPGFDLVHLDSIHMMGYAKPLERILGRMPPVFYDWHNIESEAMRRYAESTPSQARRIYAELTAAKLETLEREILTDAAGHIVCSEREKKQLQRLVPKARIAVIENGVDCSYFAELEREPVRRRIVFVGKMDYHPNVEAVVGFARRTWPMITDRLKDLTLSIVGANPTAAVQALGGLPGIEVTGTVPDVRPYYRDALAAVVPLRTGGGTRLKILEAMAAEVPVISTPLGAEGLTVSPGVDILISKLEDHTTWVRHLAELANSDERRKQITDNALHLVQTSYDWSKLGQCLVETYTGWLK
jgi:glycosyltransferase involved in cell wall biosynthesis